MLGRLLASLLWLTFVHSDDLSMVPIVEAAVKMPITMPAFEDSARSMEGTMSIKTKRYLSHQHSSPCPPFYPHIGMHMPMYDAKPYGPPAYPKSDPHPIMHQSQYIHQPIYTSYVPKQFVKMEQKLPIYRPIVAPPIHHIMPIQPIAKQPQYDYHYHYQQPMLEHKIPYPKQPIFSYAPAYHKPMIWPATQIKKYEYPINQISHDHHQQPMIVYKPEPPKCAPCPQPIQPIYHSQASLPYVKIIQQPAHPVVQSPSKVYLPAAVHQPIVKPCID